MASFRYSLDPMLKQYEWEIDALKVELMTLNQALHGRLMELQQLNEAVRGAEEEILSLYQAAVIARDRKAIVELYLRDRRQCAEEKQREVVQARALVDQVFQQLSKKKQAQRGIEKHRERKKEDFETEERRLNALEADDVWLAKIAMQK